MLEPIYSWDDSSTHAPARPHAQELGTRGLQAPGSHQHKSLEAAASAAAGTAAGTAATGHASKPAEATARRFSRPVSADDMSFGLAGMAVPGSSSTSTSSQQQQQAKAQATAAQSTAPGAGSNAPGTFTGGPSLTQQHSDWHSDNPHSKGMAMALMWQLVARLVPSTGTSLAASTTTWPSISG
ncbi:hypothetical protein COO60DRAFT_556858 [Scenedesmus sp. NREL 46B-D3]|nr:hypothetical protein COO60DRAFT_556858 [Scenedesmus sp. NREL 46B-D3]